MEATMEVMFATIFVTVFAATLVTAIATLAAILVTPANADADMRATDIDANSGIPTMIATRFGKR
jgi:hypothetical protein